MPCNAFGSEHKNRTPRIRPFPFRIAGFHNSEGRLKTSAEPQYSQGFSIARFIIAYNLYFKGGGTRQILRRAQYNIPCRFYLNCIHMSIATMSMSMSEDIKVLACILQLLSLGCDASPTFIQNRIAGPGKRGSQVKLQ